MPELATKPEPDVKREPAVRREPDMKRQETLTKLLCWKEDTPVEYKPEGKRPGTASYVRYERYAKAKTVGEALALGSKAEDFINDFMKGILKVTGGPVREKPLKMEDFLQGEGITDTDRALAKFAKGFHRVEFTNQIASELGMDSKTVAKRSWCESPAMRAKRLVAQKTAEATLKELEEQGGKVTDSHILTLLRQWSFRRNDTRRNVTPEGRRVVDSDTFGVLRNQAGVWILTHASRDYPAVTKLLVRWLQDSLPMEGLSCTSIHVNSGFASRRHRDTSNLGPTVVRALGDFSSGGQLWYWPEDNGVGALECLPAEARVSLDVRSAPALIDGNRAHEVEPFEGERFGIVFYTMAKSEKIPAELRTALAEYGFNLPDKEARAAAGRLFAVPKGYGLAPVPRPDAPKRRRHKEDAPGAQKRACKAKVARLGGQGDAAKAFLMRFAQGAKVAVEGKAKEAHEGGESRQAPLKFKTKGKDEPKLGKLGVLKLKSKASGGLLARMLLKRTPQGEQKQQQKQQQQQQQQQQQRQEGSAAQSSTESVSSPEAPASAAARSSGSATRTSGAHPGGLLARVLAAKQTKEAATGQAAPAAATGAEGGDTPPRKRPGSSGADHGTGSAAAGTLALSAKKTAAPAGGRSGAQAVTVPGKVEKPGAGAAQAPAVAAGAAEASQAAAAPAAAEASPVALAHTLRATALALGLSVEALPGAAGTEPRVSVGREAVLSQHFLPLANVVRLAEENPSSSVELLAGYFQMLLSLGGKDSETQLRAALSLLLPAKAAPAHTLVAAAGEAFGPATARLAEERGLAEALVEGRRAKRSLRAPPPRLTLQGAAEALEASWMEGTQAAEGIASLARALGTTRTEGNETLFFMKVLGGSSGLVTGSVHAAVAKAFVQVHGSAR